MCAKKASDGRRTFVSSKVPCNLIKQNCFVHECVASSSSLASLESFVSCDEVATESGISLEYTTHDYPITPASVNSYVESADYRRDPVSAVARGHHMKNLGDVASLQEVASLDLETARSLYKQLSSLFSSKASALKPSTTIPSDSSNNRNG